jgi:hypothetical protein
MAITNIGYDGTVNDIGFAQMQQYAGAKWPIVCGYGHFAVTINTGATRTCNVAAGSAYAPGVLSTSDAIESAVFDVVSTAGQTRWDAVVLRRDWSTGDADSGTTVEVVKGTAAASAPMITPAGVDVALDSTLDQVLALVQITNGQPLPTSVVDRRLWGSKKFTVPSSAAVPNATAALYGMELETPGGQRYRCLTDISGAPAWVLNAAPSVPHMSRYRNASMTMVSGTNYTVDFNNVATSQGNIAYASGVATVATPGVYQVNANLHYQTSVSVGQGAAFLLKNGAAVQTRAPDFRGGDLAVGVSAAVACVAGDTLAIRALQTSGANLTLFSSSNRYTTLDITYLGA